MTSAIDPEKGRAALADLPTGTSRGQTPTSKDVYLPPAHVKAMDPDNLLVTGMRGAGKTFWWSALQDRSVRQLIGQSAERPTLGDDTEVRTGFGVTSAPDDYPSKDVLRERMRAGVEPRNVWRTVQACQVAGETILSGKWIHGRGASNMSLPIRNLSIVCFMNVTLNFLEKVSIFSCCSMLWIVAPTIGRTCTG